MFYKTSMTPVSPLNVTSDTTVVQTSTGTDGKLTEVVFHIPAEQPPIHVPANTIPQLPNQGYHMPGTSPEGNSDMGIVTMTTTVLPATAPKPRMVEVTLRSKWVVDANSLCQCGYPLYLHNEDEANACEYGVTAKELP